MHNAKHSAHPQCTQCTYPKMCTTPTTQPHTIWKLPTIAHFPLVQSPMCLLVPLALQFHCCQYTYFSVYAQTAQCKMHNVQCTNNTWFMHLLQCAHLPKIQYAQPPTCLLVPLAVALPCPSTIYTVASQLLRTSRLLNLAASNINAPENTKKNFKGAGHPMIGYHTGDLASKLLRITFRLNLAAPNINAPENTKKKL